MTIQQIHDALSNGKTVHWENSLYHLHYVDCKEDNEYGKLSYKEGKAIRVTCTSNYFGSLISESCLKKCFIKE